MNADAERRLRICDFLWFGFVPSEEFANHRMQEIEGFLTDPDVAAFDRHSMKSVKSMLVSIVERLIGDATTVRVPVSAGLDSRGLLGATLEVLPADRIVSYTLGHPGADDFERARGFTRGVLPEHHLIDVSDRRGSWDTEDAVHRISGRPSWVVREIGEWGQVEQPAALQQHVGAPLLNGFLGDSISGKKLPPIISGRWGDAVDRFVRRNRPFKGTVSLTPEDYEPRSRLPGAPLSSPSQVLMDDQLDWCFRQHQRIRPVRSHAQEGEHNLIRSPYGADEWLKSFVSLPTEKRIDQAFYRSFLGKAFPAVFPDLAEPSPRPSWTRRLIRRGRKVPAPSQKPASKMHIDHDLMFAADSGGFRSFCVDNIRDLADRDLVDWLDLPGVVAQATADPTAFGRQMYGLASLEINIKAGRI